MLRRPSLEYEVPTRDVYTTSNHEIQYRLLVMACSDPCVGIASFSKDKVVHVDIGEKQARQTKCKS